MRPVAHLIPSVDSVAVRAQKAKISCVSGPILESVTPGRGASYLSSPVDVIDVENAKVGLSALHAGPAKALDEGYLALPVARTLMRSEPISVPMCAAAVVRTISVLAFLSTSLAIRASLPSGGEVAGPPAVLPGAIFKSVGMGLEGLGTASASGFNTGLLHGISMPDLREPKYFDIACRRIEDAQRQSRMFV